MIITMGLVQKSSLSEYWETSSLTGTPGISELMSREQFLQIYKTITFFDPNKLVSSKEDRYGMLRDTIIRNSQIYFMPGKELSLDGSLIDWKGRLDIKVFMPLKRTLYGMKAYMLCDSKTSYIYSWKLHMKHSQTISRIVMPICMNIEGEGHVIYFDRFYTSPTLFYQLDLLGI